MNQPKNIIYKGVAGTGKTYQLQHLAEHYSEVITPVDKSKLLAVVVESLNWREVICLVFLQHKLQGKELLKVGEIVEHPIFQAKAIHNDRNKNLKQSVWGTLQQYSSSDSRTVNYKNRASQAYFDKDETSSWYLLDESVSLLKDLQSLLDDYLLSVQKTESNSQMKVRYSMVGFHQAYGYDEFVEGIRPIIDEKTGQMRYQVRDGAFLKLCKQAEQDPSHRYAMLIDEINRANVSQVFGELMSLIEPSKRAGQPQELSIQLAYSGRELSVPSNIDIYATMNTQDNSLTALDSAFRRRFEFIEMVPDSSGLGQVKDINGEMIELSKLLDGLNNRIVETLGQQSRLGQSYFYGINNISQLVSVMAKQIIPQLLSHTTHQPHVLVDILQLGGLSDNQNSLQWVVPVIANSEVSSMNRNGWGGLNGSNTQTDYQLNPQLMGLIDNKILNRAMNTSIDGTQKIADNEFETVLAFKCLYP